MQVSNQRVSPGPLEKRYRDCRAKKTSPERMISERTVMTDLDKLESLRYIPTLIHSSRRSTLLPSKLRRGTANELYTTVRLNRTVSHPRHVCTIRR